MFRKLLGMLAGVGVVALVASATDVSGLVSGTWTEANNPYNVVGEITVPAGQTLTIMPGVEVLFQGNYGITVHGGLCAHGTIEDSVRFSMGGSTNWKYIFFQGSNIPDSSMFDYCIFDNGSQAILLDHASVSINNSELRFQTIAIHGVVTGGIVYDYITIINSKIHHSIGTGIQLDRPVLHLQNSSISYCGGSGLDIAEGSFSMTGGYINYNTGDGIRAQQIDSSSIQDFEIAHNGQSGINTLPSNDLTISRTIIHSNYLHGIVMADHGDLYAYNITISSNGHDSPTSQGSGIHAVGVGINISSSVIDHNKNYGIFQSDGIANLIYNDAFQNSGANYVGCIGGIGSISQDPLFVSLVNNNFNLLEGSPCIDAGNPFDPLDPDSTCTDMGALFYDQSAVSVIVVSTDSLDFGEVQPDVSVSMPLTIYNQGTANLIISGMITATPFSTNFNPQDSLVAPGDSLVVTVQFRPHEITTYTGMLTIQNNDEPVTVQLQGAGVGPVNVILTPTNPPIIIPPEGGSFSFNINLTNLTANNQVTDFWSEIILPEMGSVQVLTAYDIALPGNISINRLRSQQVPASAPNGAYYYFAYVGDYPWTVQDFDSFAFRKTLGEYAGGSLGSPADWPSTGESFGLTAGDLLPSSFCLLPSSPNPFNPSTALSYELRAASQVRLTVYDTAGRLVTTLVDGMQAAGPHTATFDGSDLPSGIYFARLQAGDFSQTRKLILLK